MEIGFGTKILNKQGKCFEFTIALNWIVLSVLNCSSQRSSKDHPLLIQCYNIK